MIYRDASGRLKYPAVLVYPDGKRHPVDLDGPARRVEVPTLDAPEWARVRRDVVTGEYFRFGVLVFFRTREVDAEGRRIYR